MIWNVYPCCVYTISNSFESYHSMLVYFKFPFSTRILNQLYFIRHLLQHLKEQIEWRGQKRSRQNLQQLLNVTKKNMFVTKWYFKNCLPVFSQCFPCWLLQQLPVQRREKVLYVDVRGHSRSQPEAGVRFDRGSNGRRERPRLLRRRRSKDWQADREIHQLVY